MSVTIRTATQEDIPAIAALHVAGWQGAYGGIVDQAYLDNFTVEMRIPKWQEHFDKGESKTKIAYIADKPVGFVDYGSLKTPPAGTSKIRPLYSSEIYALYLRPEYYRQGLGTSLFKAAVEDLKHQKHQSLCLWVLDKNKRGCAFYEKMCGSRIGNTMIEIGPNKLKEICYGWRDILEIINK